MRNSRAIKAGLAALAICGVGAVVWILFDTPFSQQLDLPQPANFAELDPDVAQLVRTHIAAVQDKPDDILRWVHLGMAYEANEQPVLAVETYSRITELVPKDSRGWFGLAKVSAKLGEIDEAERAMRRAIELEPDYAPSHWRLGYWLFEQGRIDEAAQHFARATNIEKDDPAAWFGMARVHLARNDTLSAITMLEWLSKAPPPNGPYAWQLLATAYARQGRADDAETARLRGQGAAPDFRDSWDIEVAKLERGFGSQLNQAKALLAFGKPDECIALLKRLHERRPEDPMVLSNLATAYRAVGKLEESRNTLKEALALQPSFIHANFGMAATLWAEAQTLSRQLAMDAKAEEALEYLKRTLALNASYAPAYALRGEILTQLDRHEEAAAMYDRAYTLQPQQVTWLRDAAHNLIAIEAWDDAVAMLDTVTRQAPELAEAWSDYSIALAHLGRTEDAQVALARAQQLAPAASHAVNAQRQLQNRDQPKAVGP